MKFSQNINEGLLHNISKFHIGRRITCTKFDICMFDIPFDVCFIALESGEGAGGRKIHSNKKLFMYG